MKLFYYKKATKRLRKILNYEYKFYKKMKYFIFHKIDKSIPYNILYTPYVVADCELWKLEKMLRVYNVVFHIFDTKYRIKTHLQYLKTQAAVKELLDNYQRLSCEIFQTEKNNFKKYENIYHGFL